MEYIEETGRNFGERYKEHLRVPCPIFNHSQTKGYLIKLETFSIVDRESQVITRTIKEDMHSLPFSNIYYFECEHNCAYIGAHLLPIVDGHVLVLNIPLFWAFRVIFQGKMH